MAISRQISDNGFSFTINAKFDMQAQLISSHKERIEHKGLTWNINIYKSRSRSISVMVFCGAGHDKPWDVLAFFTVRIVGKDGKTRKTVGQEVDFGHSGHNTISSIEVEQFEMETNVYSEANDYSSYLLVKCSMEVESYTNSVTPPIPANPFSEKNGDVTDVMLVVEDKNFHVNKGLLASFSPVFRAMFQSGFQETTGNRVDIKDVNCNDFQQLLQFLYHQNVELSIFNINVILMLADRYDIPFITQKCESFLLSSQSVSNEEKKQLAQLYRLDRLKNNCSSLVSN